MKTLNIGCGMDHYGDIRIDKTKTPACNLICDIKEGIPLDNNSIDEIRCWAVLEHVENPEYLIKECYRVLKKNGKIDLLTDYAGFIGQYIFKSLEHNNRLEIHYGREKNPTKDDGHYALYVPSHLKRLLKGFDVQKIYYCYGRRGKVIEFILKCLPFHFGAVNVGVIAIKK